jgi:hypothetical protein
MGCIFGILPITSDELSNQLKTKAIGRNPGEKNRPWTRAIMESMAEIATAFGGKPLYSNNQSSEFMLDFVWWDPTQQRAIVALESEWGNPWEFRKGREDVIAEEVDRDFWKLLSFKAPIKILVYSALNRNMRTVIHEKLILSLTKFSQHVQGEIYLFVEFSPDSSLKPGEYACYRFEHRVAGNGTIQQPELVPMDEASRLASQSSKVNRASASS